MTELPPAVAETIESSGRGNAPAGLVVDETVAPQSVRDASRVMKAAAHDGVTVGFAGSGTNLELGGLGRFDLGMVSSGLSEIIDYQPEDLVGKLTVLVANLAPRKMRFGVSEGMVLAAGPGGEDIYLLEPHAGAAPGMQVK